MTELEKMKILVKCSEDAFNIVESASDMGDTDAVLLALWHEIIQLSCEFIVLYEANNGSVGQSALIREMFEISLYVLFIMQSDSVFRASCYAYFYHKNELQISQYFKSGTKEHSELIAIKPALAKLSALLPDVDGIIANEQSIMQQSKYDVSRSADLGEIRYWFTLVDKTINSNRMLAKHLNMESEYITLYKIFCQQTHGMRVLKNAFTAQDFSPINYCVVLQKQLIKHFKDFFDAKYDIGERLNKSLIGNRMMDTLDRVSL